MKSTRISKKTQELDVKDMFYSNISERVFTKQVIQLAKVFGWHVAHFRAAMTQSGRWVTPVQGDAKGFPDMFMLRGRRVLIAELKSARGRVEPAQAAWLALAKEAGLEVHVWRPAEIEQIERILK